MASSSVPASSPTFSSPVVSLLYASTPLSKALTCWITRTGCSPRFDTLIFSSSTHSSAASPLAKTRLGFSASIRRCWNLFRDVVSWTSMVAGYCKRGDIDTARKMFDEMPERNLVTWSVMINGYVKNNCFVKAIELFESMKRKGIQANETVMVSVISSCAHLGGLELGEKAHDYVVKNNLTVNVILGTALVDMYARCGNIEKAIRVFEELPEKDSLSWTSIISGLAMYGHGNEAIHYFSEMVRLGFTPRDITFTAVLSACSHGGLVDRGLEIYESMKRDHGIEPRLEHYGCIVDMLSRAGRLVEAENFILEMPVKPNAPILGALLGACRIHQNAEVAERVGNMLIELKPEHSGYYVLLSNIYARAKKWENVENLRETMKEKRVKKPPGWSLIEIDGKINKFSMGDDMHPEMEDIKREWEEILRKIRPVGYKGNTDDAFFDIDEEEKESVLHMHSEKLAIAYGIMKTGPDAAIRIVKNLRVCEDCHTATKLISKVYGREFIVRDRNRFHRFRNGICSCGDYW
ncbi:PREDICTED: pentatricopeptide repeat-containing protein At5g06540 isoform X2 [Tarenaya hassleriana]|uniref:pentatricopeptide repeat-containing protein At5g06540 isoform X2 n=1 Tax=Tarenaya hassleriana TaxID=28532 RepID=UPI0008FD8121|nr:PREDICTED: pentatricopeptide repeat-containing protein At5g06540 isoform X2 [Tarenaya hassleriana]